MVFIFKVVLVGDGDSGKTALIRRYIEGTFGTTTSQPRENGVRQVVKTIAIRGETVDIQICELANEKETTNTFKPNNTYRGAHAILLLFSLFHHDSCQSIPSWLEEISRYCYGNVKVILVGTKADTLFNTNATKTNENKTNETNNKITKTNITSNKNNINNTNDTNRTDNINITSKKSDINNINEQNKGTSKVNDGRASFATLPIEILDHVFKHLDLRSLLFACFVNWDWYRILNSQDTWTRLYKRDFKVPPSAAPLVPHHQQCSDWKTAYIQKYMTTSSAIHKARELAHHYGLPLVLTSARTALNVNQLFSEIAHLLFEKVKHTDEEDEMQTIPLWRGRACTVLLKEKGGREGERSHSNPLFKNFLTPHRIQISDSKLFVRGIETTSIKCIILGRDIVSVYVDEHDRKPNVVALKLHTRQGNNYTFLFETQARAEMWRTYITNM